MLSHDPESTFFTGPANDRTTAKQAQVLACPTMFTFEGRLKLHIKEGCAPGAKAVYSLKRDRVVTGAADFASFPRAAHSCIPPRMIVRASGLTFIPRTATESACDHAHALEGAPLVTTPAFCPGQHQLDH
jgi:hypothetical protein